MTDGFVTILKPPGMTSNNAVYDVRRIFQVKRVGHLGTLDPGAAGVLPVSIGRATRLFDYLVEKEKVYIFEILFGTETDTLDVFGTVTETDPGRTVSEAELESVLKTFLGEQEQTVPAYSALKIDGKKMYDLARSGGKVPEKRHMVRISELSLIRQTGENRYLMRTVCSKGTYIRQLCHDIAEAVGTKGCMSFLLRTCTGHFSIEHAYSIRELEQLSEQGGLDRAVISCEQALCDYPELRLERGRRIPAMNGLETSVRRPDGIYRVYCEGFLGLGTVWNDSVRLTVHLY